MSKKVFITGASGQDGQFLIDYLLENTDYEVFAFSRKIVERPYKRFKYIPFALSLEYVNSHHPDYFINLAGFSNPRDSYDNILACYDTNLNFVIQVLDRIKNHAPNCRFVNAGSCHEFLVDKETPYSLSKTAARDIVNLYREQYGIWAIQVTLSNHISHLRDDEFVDGKVFKGVKEIADAISNRKPFEPIMLDNVGVFKDWSHAKDVVKGIWLVAEKGDPDENYYLGSAKAYSIQDLVLKSFWAKNIEGVWIQEYDDTLFVLPNYLSDFCDVRSQVLVRAKHNNSDHGGVYAGGCWGRDNSLKLGWRPNFSFSEMVQDIMSH